jgi:prepilin-type processing-associated H-X9-DG protein
MKSEFVTSAFVTHSVSMNTLVGTRIGSLQNQYHQKYETIRQPSRIFVLAEEHEDSIDDGNMLVPVRNPWGAHNGAFPSLVASRHGGKCSFSFADGHVESKKWADSRTTVEPRRQKYPLDYRLAMGADNPDVGWLADRAK